MTRRLAAIFVADAVGYSSRMGADEMATHREAMADLDSLFKPQVQEHGGRIVKTTGDGLIAEFGSAVDAVQCGIDVQRAVAARGADGEPNSSLRYRIGINLADVIVEESDIYGDGVNVAVRLEALARPGAISISEGIYHLVRAKFAMKFEDIGPRKLKNIAERVHVYRVDPGTVLQRAALVSSVAERPANTASIVVLPFVNFSAEADQQYFCNGMTEDLITALSKFPELLVIASHTAFFYQNRSYPAKTIARDLNVRYVVEGSIQRGGSRVRINVQLIDGVTECHLWAGQYDRPTTQIFAIQDEIVHSIVANLITRVDEAERMSVRRKAPTSFQAYDYYLRGRDIWFGWTRQSNKFAQEMFERAVDLDPNFARAYGYLSFTLLQAWYSGWTDQPSIMERALVLARKAVALGPSDYDNHWSLASAQLYRRQFEEAATEFQRALSLNPNDPALLADMAEAMIYLGHEAEAVVQIQQAMSLNPIHPEWYRWVLGWALYLDERYDDALAVLNSVANPPNRLRRHLIATYVCLHRLDEARRLAAEFLRNDPDYCLEKETLLPYRDASKVARFVGHLRAAGLS